MKIKTLGYRSGAFSLVEVTLALGIITFCLVTLFGLLPIGLRSNQAAAEQTAANGILSAVMADLRSTPALSGTSTQFSISIPTDPTTKPSPATLYFTSDGQSSSVAQARYRMTVSFLPNGTAPANGTSRAATLAELEVSWPAAIDPAHNPPNGSVQTFVAMDRN